MVKTLSLVLTAIVLASTVACGSNAVEEQEVSTSAAATPIADGEWEFRVNRVIGEESAIERLPSDRLTEDDFVPVSEGGTESVTVSQNGSEVLIRLGPSADDLVTGSLRAVVNGEAKYDLAEGTGGRFLVWLADGSLQAELALYGSGVPLAMCVRGVLVPSP